MRRARFALVATGLFFSGVPAHAQTYDPSYPVCMQIYGPVGYFDCRYDFARTVQISRRRPLRELRREPVLSAEEVKGSPAAEAGRLGVLPCRDLPTLTPLRA